MIDRSIYLSVCLPVCLSTCKLGNEAILRDFLDFWSWQHPKRSNSARFPQFLNLATSKTKTILRDLLNVWTWQHQKRSNSAKTSFKNGKLSAELPASYQCVWRFFHFMPLKYCACHEKLMPGHTKCCTCHAKSSSQNWRFDAPKCNPSQEISALTFPRLPSFWQLLQNPHVLLTFDKVHNPLRLPRENDIWTSKSGPSMWCL